MSERAPNPIYDHRSDPGFVCPICETERRKQRRRKTVRPNRILAEHPNHTQEHVGEQKEAGS